jgi:hypothetical protein
MNELIKELANQADQYANQQNELYGVDFKTEYDQKFAELIVQECAMLVEGFEITQEVALDEYVDYEASSVLKEHFGVEE